MGCACSFKKLDVVAPAHKRYGVPSGAKAKGAAGAAPSSPPAAGRGFCQVAPPARCGEQEQPPAGLLVATYEPEERDREAETPERILAEGSQLHHLRLLPWDEQDADVAGNFGLSRGGPGRGERTYADADGLPELSKRQREALHSWRRLPEVVSRASGAPEPVVLACPPTSRAICQGLVGDCSFLSALSALAEYERRFREPVLSGIMHPKVDAGSGLGPVYNEYGQYGCRLFLNGTARKVVVDDRVPVRHDGRLLCAHSACAHELWVTLLEKSFAKIMGSSYDMQGSNPGTDIFHLTGWVPETIPLNGERTAAGRPAEDPGASWEEVFGLAAEGYRDGRCVLCVGTSELADAAPDAEARRHGRVEGVSTSTGLVARHAYPVLDCRRLGPHRLLRLKNPWGRERWRGRFAPGDAAWAGVPAAGAAGLRELLGHDPTAEAVDDGHFWIAWEDVVHYFSHLYLGWSPGALGAHRVEAHGRFDPWPHFARSAMLDDFHLMAWTPQFLLRFEGPPPAEGVAAWVLLSRHVRVRAELSSKYVAAHVYSGKERVCCPNQALEQGVYSNGECALVKLRGDVASGQREFVLAVSQHAHKTAFNFTLQVYSNVPATLAPLPPAVPDDFASGAALGSWTAKSSGGCSNNLWRYFQNPQWRIQVPRGGKGLVALVLFLECPSEYSVNVRLFRGRAARPESLRQASSSGPYRQGCCVLRVLVPPGPYVAVVSTFRTGLCGEYRLGWHASEALEVAPQPHPFVLAHPSPLECAAWPLPGKRVARFRLAAAGARPTLLSVRFQGGRTEGAAPSLSLAAGGSAACELLTRSFAESYFALSGAAVLLLSALEPGVAYVLEVFHPQEVPQGNATVHLVSDGQLSVEGAE